MPASLQEIANAFLASSGTIDLAGVVGAARGLIAARLARALPGDPLLLLVASDDRARELIDDIASFLHPDELPRLRLFPESSVLPYSRLSPEPEDWAERLRTLYDLLHGKPLIIVATVAAAMRRCPPREFIARGARTVRHGELIDPKELSAWLTDYGYEECGLCEDEGSFARRGGILDVWPPTAAAPVRLELDGERLASLRAFDPASQRSRGELREILLIPVRDIPFDEASRAKAAHRIRERSDASTLSGHERRVLIEAIHEGIALSGIETLMPLFHDATAELFDYLSPKTRAVIDDAVEADAAAEAHRREIAALYADTQSPERVVAPDEVVLPAELFRGRVGALPGIRFNALRVEGEGPATMELSAGMTGNAELRALVQGAARHEDMLSPLARQIRTMADTGWRVVLTCHTEVQAERLKDLFRWHEIRTVPFDGPFEQLDELAASAVRLRIGRISAGFRWEAERLAVITDAEIFGGKAPRRRPTSRPMEPFTSFAELTEGDLLVHEQHGIGRYLGLKHLQIDASAADFLLLEYLGGDRLYLPVYRLNLVGRYIGSGDAAPALDRLGGTRWAQLRRKVAQEIRQMAKELLQIYAARQVHPGTPLPESGAPYEEFAAAFPYDETPDQERAIDEIMRDLSIERPMDRLVCGDVGYGKTEVAMRAAYRAVLNGMQVAVLVPTTVLAFQHHESFQRRFAGTAVGIGMLSRFVPPKKQKETIGALRDGSCDIVIGTHRLLQKDIGFRNLGLLIIDEEHRFGVRHKERIKKLRSTVHVMAMTATPIPRTLNFSLTGIRDISVINTPPADRQSIATYVAPFDEGIVRQAILREMARGGQVFFVHNRVETIGSMRDRLARLVPEARIVVGHGQLPEHALERVMIEFLEKRADVLLCTTIIESGLDIPSANTILINRADAMGLAQLYQLRGRVGRSSVRACAYLLTPPDGEMSPIARKRLTVLKRFTELGSGFQIAMHDLEFRGAGNILGSAQHGHIAAVGYELYTRLLERAVRQMTGKKTEEEIDPELNLKVSAFLPESYVPDPGARIDLYKRLSSRESEAEIGALADELSDRFGPLPPEAGRLLGVMEVRLLARRLRIRQLSFDGAQLACQLDAASPLTTQQVLRIVQAEPSRYRIVPPDRLVVAVGRCEGDAAVIAAAKNSLSALAAYVSGNAAD